MKKYYAGMLGWFVNSQSVEAALSGTLLTAQDIKQSPSDISSACLDIYTVYENIFVPQHGRKC